MKIKTLNILSLIIIFFFIAPYLFLGQNVYISVWDNLDSDVAVIKTLIESGKYWTTDDIIPNMFNNLSRLSFHSSPNFYYSLYYIDPFIAIVINKIVTIIAGFIGMKLFLKNYVLNDDNDDIIIYGVSLCYGLIPFWTGTSISLALIPLTFYAFLNIRNGKHSLINWILILLIPFFSDFIRIYLFVIICLGFLLLYDLITTKKVNLKFLLSIAIFSILFLIIEYRLIIFVLEKPFVGHRDDWIVSDLNIVDSIKDMINQLFFGQNHVKSLHTYIILPVTLLGLIFLFKNKVILYKKKFFISLSIILLFSFIYGIYYYEGFQYLYNSKYNPLKALVINRFYWIQPFLWYTLFAISLKIIKSEKRLKYLPPVIILIQLLVIFKASPQFSTFKKHEDNIITYKEFYSVELFEEIKKEIPEDLSSFKTLSLGLYPSIPLYNNFYTLDGYFNNYPITYKREFRQLIAIELEESNNIKNYFDYWGSRCYLFSSEIVKNYEITKDSPIKSIDDLDLNTTKFKEMNGLYLFSTVLINNSNEIGLNLIKTFEREDSPWRIHLYKLK